MQRDVEFKLRYTAKILSSVSYLQACSPTFPFIPPSPSCQSETITKYLVHFMVKSDCIHVPCHPRAAPRHLPPEPLPGVTDSCSLLQVAPAGLSHSLWEGCNSPIFSPQLWLFGCSGTRWWCPAQGMCCVLLWDVNIPAEPAAGSCCATYWVWMEPGLLQFPELNCTDVLVLTHKRCRENTIKSDILIFAVY